MSRGGIGKQQPADHTGTLRDVTLDEDPVEIIPYEDVVIFYEDESIVRVSGLSIRFGKASVGEAPVSSSYEFVRQGCQVPSKRGGLVVSERRDYGNGGKLVA